MPYQDIVYTKDTRFELNGNPWFVIGHNADPTFLTTAYLNGQAGINNYIKRMAEHGENVLHLPLEPLPFGFIEQKTLKNYDDAKALLDPIYEACQLYPVKISMEVYFIHFAWVSSHPYSANHLATKGPAKTYNDFWNNSAVLDLLKNRFIWLNERYGGPTTFQFELMNEIYAWPQGAELMNNWVDQIVAFAKSVTKNLISISIQNDSGDPTWHAWTHPSIDFLSFEAYGSPPPPWGLSNLTMFYPYLSGTGEQKLAQRLTNVKNIINRVRTLCTDKPILCSEIPYTPFSPGDKKVCGVSTISNTALEDNFYSSGILFMDNGCAGSGLTWGSERSGAIVDGKTNALTPRMYELQLKTRNEAIKRNFIQ